ncbi:hypothetical protein G9X67_16725 [Rhizobium sp. WYCCWR 11152]|uniref:hypothetical protein n=1 Tax=Rhizobium sp. WYCCWR 11152 TaxID=2692316 RepID=UPI001492D3DA|nr:hypothetical protein [Rhizobium sp. WYCCWR 11152]NNU66915.1 hypothetical protein [Rhizobium sp. WYCCWR 11152]
MRFLHGSAVPIEEFIRAKKFHVLRYDVDGLTKPVAVPPSEVSELLDRSQIAWGARAPYYLSAGMAEEQAPLSLEEAVRQIERTSGDEFLLDMYVDGGLISVSASVLEFQRGASEANWWHPRPFKRRWRDLPGVRHLIHLKSTFKRS